ncbi:MAG TPA: iron ABC transporter permease [Chloroflexus aurantiacus]|uniref:Binding-protein-dependent transport systems inner membrane component n=1 Tax=Chloroflexus aurantiacus (strain ATCC 29366 / DSM 635 / J-10-fl) TaxID=324602 RepID=A9WD06_CHLAA|nr:iron ABC transporter permease [Chloroflexus aurantiacus]ABY33575.1 binding-protein-dependent transport systems inner membrane component [Chloroflexus aurantiacus J-10-fl]HBW67200.1 iron ABC transporter permease [Chloroflexus aurantiacus]
MRSMIVPLTRRYWNVMLIKRQQLAGNWSLPDRWSIIAFLIAGLALLPIAIILRMLVQPAPDVWQHLWATRLAEFLSNTVVLLIRVGLGTTLLGTALAWLVTAYRFPGQRLFDWALMLPMAVPSYVLAFVFMATFDYAGPVQKALRAWFGSSAWFPSIRSGGGAIFVMTLTLYPYVYLLARAAFHEHGRGTFEVARTLGVTRLQAFLRVVLPMARPSLVAGLSLVLMEVLTDVGTVRFLNFPTLSDGIFRIWHGMMDRDAALQSAAVLLLFAFGALLIERYTRGRARYVQEGSRGHGLAQVPLTGWRALAATLVCSFVLATAFLLPVSQLIQWSVHELWHRMPEGLLAIYWRHVRATLILAGAGAVISVLAAVLLAYGTHLSRSPVTRLAARGATLGYAIPGAVIGLGVLLPLSWLDHTLNDVTYQWWGVLPGLIFTGSITGLIYAYVVRFMAVAHSSVEASLEKISPGIEAAARTLGARPIRVLWHVHLPLIRAGMLTGAALVFVDVMKELPITLLLRPFGYETLALWIWQNVAESLWSEAALPALTIVVADLLVVGILIRSATLRGRHSIERT